jgi:hypothetical protein
LNHAIEGEGTTGQLEIADCRLRIADCGLRIAFRNYPLTV